MKKSFVLMVCLASLSSFAETYVCPDQEMRGAKFVLTLKDGETPARLLHYDREGKLDVDFPASHDSAAFLQFNDPTPVDWSKVPPRRCWTGHGTLYTFEHLQEQAGQALFFIQPAPYFAVRPETPNCVTPKLQLRGGMRSWCQAVTP